MTRPVDLTDRPFLALGRAAERLTARSAWGAAVGLARSLLAVGLALTLLSTPTRALFFVVDGEPQRSCEGLADTIGLFCLVPDAGLGAARVLAALALLAIATGWRPRLTALPHWWLTFSFFTSSVAVDGGDHVAGVLTLLLLPLSLSDPRRWHWTTAPAAAGSWGALIAWGSLSLLRLQVAVIYLHAAIAKFGVAEWADGTALYYWFQHPFFGAPTWTRTIADPVLTTGVGVSALTWGTLVLELALVVAIIGRPTWRRPMLTIGIVFHVGIALVMGLVSFAFSMTAALLLALWAPDELRWVTRVRAHRLRRREVDTPATVAPTDDPSGELTGPTGEPAVDAPREPAVAPTSVTTAGRPS